MKQRTRGKGEQGIAIITTALVLLPLMIFAAYGVDVASWYSRVSYLQKSADAGALAGTVWMPNLTRSTTEACASLAQNGISGGPSCGSGPFNVTVERGATATSLRVLVTDPDAQRYFSQVFRGTQSLTRSAEAEYNLPIPLGSPLNYFGGDADRTNNITHQEVRDVVVWPTDYNQVVHAPVNAPCNIGTLAGQGFGRWTSPTTFDSGGFSGSTRCLFEPRQGTNSGTITVAPPDYDRLTNVPTNTPCNAFASPTNGRWTSATVWSATTRYSSGTGNRQCTWRNWSTSSVPSTAYRALSASINGSVRPCNLTYQDILGRWPASGAYVTNNRFTGLHTAGNQFCQYYAEITAQTFTVADPNPISASRSPGFWAAIEGPQTRAYQGDAYSTRCYVNTSCTSDQNVMYLQPSNADRGFWYVVKIPAGLSGSVSLNVFDASFVAGSTNVGAGDRTLDGGGNFTTTYRVYQQTNALDFSARTPVTASAANTTEGSCNWAVDTQTSFQNAWRNLCTISASAGQTYLVNVQTTGTTGGGVNGYALEAVSGNDHNNTPQPALYAYSNMGMQNNNSCSGTGCAIPPATFYLAEVGPQYAGRTLVMELWDSGDVGSGVTSTMSPMRPSPTLPRPVSNVPAADCTYTADANPNARISGVTGPEITTAQGSDDVSICAIQSTVAGTQRFNGEWLRIRIDIPPTYDCVIGVNPETTANSCWWGIRYSFSGGSGSSITANDVTTWQARIEGNPVHLTE